MQANYNESSQQAEASSPRQVARFLGQLIEGRGKPDTIDLRQ